MKPIQVGILVAVAAVAGGLITKWATSRSSVPDAPAASAAAPATPAPATPVAQAAQPAPEAEAAHPSPFPEEKPAKEAAHKKRAWHRAEPAEPRVIAQNLPPAAPAAAPASVQQAEPAPRTQPAAPEPAVQVPEAPALPPPAPRQVTLSPGILIPARTVEGLSSDRNQAGDGFTATLDAPLVVDGLVIAERGAHLEGKVVQSEKAGRVKGVSELAIELTQINLSDGQRVAIETESFVKHGQTSKGEDAAKVGGGAALGAIIGAIAGGGKGAAIGTAVGGAAGAGTVAATRGKAVAIAPETRISFRLRNPVTITERQNR